MDPRILLSIWFQVVFMEKEDTTKLSLSLLALFYTNAAPAQVQSNAEITVDIPMMLNLYLVGSTKYEIEQSHTSAMILVALQN